LSALFGIAKSAAAWRRSKVLVECLEILRGFGNIALWKFERRKVWVRKSRGKKKPPMAWSLKPPGANSTGTPAQLPSAAETGDAQIL